jgi:hypothetical protein
MAARSVAACIGISKTSVFLQQLKNLLIFSFDASQKSLRNSESEHLLVALIICGNYF